MLDIVLTMLLVWIGVSPFFSSFAGAGAAVTFVYAASLSSVFRASNLDRLSGYLAYILWQLFAISIASTLIAGLALLIEPLWTPTIQNTDEFTGRGDKEALSIATGVSKLMITPITLSANFFFMRWLTGRRALSSTRRRYR